MDNNEVLINSIIDLEYHKNQINSDQLEDFTEKYIEEKKEFQKLKYNNALKRTENLISKRFKPSRLCLKRLIIKRLPIFLWLPKYDYKENLFKDFTGGINVSGL